ncbi:DNA polymerase III subunit epsilon [Pseudaminobacter arsenicus]|uniref:DNA polymerase III subunit epsilon n=1 Tax=Borborobacter arsenicus TaxID=1851146 RepID=A0A432V8V2_9HYPH|nr:DNA polymerase III subunit epsilon [Pseudaminobacter arsenicus]RUM98585.1 DNA polymerase III subunit epsilon [Pseudaminobacter arsenicus]
MREIIFDTETTGLDAREDRIIEIGGVELVNRFPTGNTFHVYINPQGRSVHPDALAVHGISDERLANEKPFPAIVDEFLAFIDGASLIAHNAGFDMGFINAELARLGHPPIEPERVVDTLALARRRHPMGPNSLDALCRRYGINNSHRNLHGALLDSELLAEVYIELIGGKQATLILEAGPERGADVATTVEIEVTVASRPSPLPPRLTDEERAAHARLVAGLGEKAVWQQLGQG